MFETPHFVTGDFTSHKLFLPDDEYGRALDCLVKACCDVIVIRFDDPSNPIPLVLLARRKVEPQPDWWFVGGRIVPGEVPEAAATRHLKRELSFDVSGHMFETIGHYSFLWGMRQQEPQNHGTADISTVVSVLVTKDEAAQFVFDDKEYAEHKWVSADVAAADATLHIALRRALADLSSRGKWHTLESAITSGASDEAVAALARDLVASDRNARALGDHRK